MSIGFQVEMKPADRVVFKEGLEEYVRLILSGGAADEIYPEVAFYIESFPECEEEYYREFRRQGENRSIDELREIGQRAPVSEVMSRIIRPVPSIPNLIEKAINNGRAWIEQSTGRWHQLQITLSNLPFETGMAPVLEGLQSAHPLEPLGEERSLHIKPDKANFELTVSVSPNAQNEENNLCQVEVIAIMEDRFGDYSGVTITLLWGENSRRQTTDELGKTIFKDLLCGQVPLMSLIVTFPEEEN